MDEELGLHKVQQGAPPLMAGRYVFRHSEDGAPRKRELYLCLWVEEIRIKDRPEIDTVIDGAEEARARYAFDEVLAADSTSPLYDLVRLGKDTYTQIRRIEEAAHGVAGRKGNVSPLPFRTAEGYIAAVLKSREKGAMVRLDEARLRAAWDKAVALSAELTCKEEELLGDL